MAVSAEEGFYAQSSARQVYIARVKELSNSFKERFVRRARTIKNIALRRNSKCRQDEINIGEQISRQKKFREEQKHRYGEMRRMVETFIRLRKSQGYQTGDVSEHLKELDKKIDLFIQHETNYYDALKDFQGVICEIDSEKHIELSALIDELKRILAADAKDIQDYYNNVIRIDIKSLK